MKLKTLLEKQIFWILLLPTLIVVIPMLMHLYKESWGLRPATESGWDIGNLIWWTLFSWSISILIFCIGYGILLFKKRSVNAWLSFFQLVFIGINIIVPVSETHSQIILLIGVWLVFIMNLVLSKKAIL